MSALSNVIRYTMVTWSDTLPDYYYTVTVTVPNYNNFPVSEFQEEIDN